MGNGGRPFHTQEELVQELKLQLCWGALGYSVTRGSEPSLEDYGVIVRLLAFVEMRRRLLEHLSRGGTGWFMF